MFYVYVLTMHNKQLYIGFTPDLKNRFKRHKEGKVFTTRKYLPVKLVYYEAYLSKEDAREREWKLKKYGSSWSQIKKRISRSVEDSQGRG